MVKYYILLFLVLPLCAFAQTNYEVFKGENVKTITPVRLVEPYFCAYKDSIYNPVRLKYQSNFNSYSTPEDILLAKCCGNYNGLTKVPVYNGVKHEQGHGSFGFSDVNNLDNIMNCNTTNAETQIFLRPFTFKKQIPVHTGCGSIDTQKSPESQWEKVK